MRLLATAKDKILKAYGPMSQPLTTLDIAAMAYSLQQSYRQKALSKGISKEQRLQDYVLSWQSQTFLTSVCVDMYPVDCEVRFPSLDSLEEVEAWLSQDDPAITSFKEKLAATDDEFYARLEKLIARNPSKYTCRSFGDFGTRLAWNANLRERPREIRGNLRLSMLSQAVDSRKHNLQLMLKVAEHYNSDFYYARLNTRINPLLGPDNEDELCMMINVIYMATAVRARTFSDEYNQCQSIKALKDHMHRSFFANSSLEAFLFDCGKLAPEEGPDAIVEIVDMGIDADDFFIVLLGFCRYYYARHQDKMTPHQSQVLRRVMMDMYKKACAIDLNQDLPSLSVILPKEKKESSTVYHSFSLFSADQRKPTIDSLLEHLRTNMKSSEYYALTDIIARTGSCMNLHVSYYVPQHEHIKKERRRVFNGKVDENEPFELKKRSFVRWVAAEKEGDLRSAGFSKEDIDVMFDTGRLPDQGKTGSDAWTIDHVIDIQAGGTNDFSNLCIMPSWLNADKADLLQLQVKNNKEPHWVLTLRPAKDQDGHYAVILNPEAKNKASSSPRIYNFPTPGA